MGIMTKPAATRATAPVTRFAECESFGRAEEELLLVLPLRPGIRSLEELLSARAAAAAALCLRALRLVKYSAEPKPVRRAEGRVPRHRLRMGCSEARMARRVGRRAEVCRDCWTRVLRRSAGWRRTADVTPEERPAKKWNVVFEAGSG